MSNKKTFLFVIALIVLVMGLSTINAAKVANDTNDNQITTQSNKDIKVTSDDTNKVQTDKKTITKKEVKTKKQATTHIINSQNFEQFFSTNGELNSTVSAGDTLDIRGEIIKNQSMYIRKPLIITSTTNNAHINLNTTAKGDTGENPGNSFTLFKGASYSNVSNIYFENTQIFVKNATGIILNNISTYAHDQTVGAGVGTVAIREYSDNITIENSHFKSENNGGRSTVAFTGVKNSLFRNNTITGIGAVGNLFYLNAYNLDGASSSDTSLNTNNTIRDNYINGTEAIAQSICYAVCICGEDNSFINNTIYHNGTGISSALVDSGDSLSVRTKIINNTIPYNSVQTPKNGTVQGNKIGTLIYICSDSEISDNTATNVSVQTKNVTIDRMNIPGQISLADEVNGLVISNSSINNVSLYGASGKYKDDIKILNNNITFFQIGSGRNAYVRNLTLSNNNISNPVVIEGRNARNIDILNNTIIIKDKETAINVSASLSDSKIDGNYLIAGEKHANDAIYLNNPSGVTIGTNYPFINITGNLTLNEPGKINFEVYSNLELPDQLNVTINGIKRNIQLSEGKGTVDFTPSTDEDVLVEASYVHGSCLVKDAKTLKIKQEDTKLTVTPSSKTVTLGNKLNITVKLTTTQDIAIKSQNVTITVDNKIFNGKTNADGEYTLEFPTETLGLNNIVAKFNKTNDYKASNATNNFTVVKPEPVATILTVTPSNLIVTLGDKLNITVKLVNTDSVPIDSQKISVTLDGQTFNGTTSNNGEYKFEFTSKTLGVNTIVAKFTGNDDYKTSNATNTFTVTKPLPATTEDLTLGKSTTLTAQFYDDTYTPAGDGKAIFRVNGKTLRNENGEVIYVDVINGRAELPNVNITSEWMKPSTTIQAVYIGDDNNDPITTTPTTVTVTKPEAQITLEAPTEATPGQEITLKATVTDDNTAVNSGRVAFKLNGKTLKDPKTGKTLYANIENGIATITYTIPAKTKAKEYTLTAIFTDTVYDRVEAESKLNVVKA